jgi:hypothetical protein
MEESKKHLSFLATLHKLGVTLKAPSSRSLHRYVDLWLPLVHDMAIKNSKDITGNLIPPPDVAWLWHSHRLAPSQYESYVCSRFGDLLEASPSFVFQKKRGNE